MISSLRGRVIRVQAPWILLEVAGVGYRVTLSVSAADVCHEGSGLFLYVHDHVREDSHELYGFFDAESLVWFERLLDVSGVGPKVALAIMSMGSAQTIQRAIMSGDLVALTSVSGVGKKIAQKIILELKGKLVDNETTDTEDKDVLAALQSLGYSSMQAREAIRRIPIEITDSSERVRWALRQGGKV